MKVACNVHGFGQGIKERDEWCKGAMCIDLEHLEGLRLRIEFLCFEVRRSQGRLVATQA